MCRNVLLKHILTSSTGTTIAIARVTIRVRLRKGIRHPKTQGTSKIGEKCIAHMKATTDLLTGRVVVQYCSTHHNHEVSLGHVRMPHDTRMKIAAQLQQGVTMERIMDNIRQNIVGGINREHLVTKQDIHNIKNQYNIEGVMRHMNDLTSVCAWVEELICLPYNPVLLFKSQGESQLDDMDNIGNDDFILGIQTEFQCDMLCKYGHMCICMDATHGTNMYDFKLVTVLVIDEFGEGIPVAWAITNREDTTMLVQFLNAIKKRTGPLQSPRWFMSDDAEQYFSAFKGVFDTKETTKLLCAWHVDRAWREALKNHVASMQTRIELYHHLRVLLMESEEGTFRVLLQQFVSLLDREENRFYVYFKDNYCNRLEQWASCFRVGTVVNTNMYVEFFHRLLKVVYLQQKQNRRIDFLLSVLLKITRDKVFDRLTKLHKGKYSHRVSEINKRHKAAVAMLSLDIPVTQKNEKSWNVPSKKDGSINYVIRLINEKCNCKLCCVNCNACVHMYTCSCMDATLHATVCKHAHLVKMTTTTTCENIQSRTACTSLPYFTNLLGDDVNDVELSKLRLTVQCKLDELSVLAAKCEQADALKTASQHVTSAIMAIRAIGRIGAQLATLPKKRKYPPNKNAEKQLRFFSTKKKRLNLSSNLKKPSQKESQSCRIHLLNQDIAFCGICLKEDDCSEENFVKWVQCCSCQIWLHVKCANCECENEYTCNFCNTALIP